MLPGQRFYCYYDGESDFINHFVASNEMVTGLLSFVFLLLFVYVELLHSWDESHLIIMNNAV